MPNLNLILKKDDRFVVTDPEGPKTFRFRGNKVNLMDIDEATALRLAADKGCTFLSLASTPAPADITPGNNKPATPGK